MNHRERFLEIKRFLQPYQNLWENEIMLEYPDPLKGYQLSWIEDLRRYQDKSDVIKLEKKEVSGYVTEPSLIAFYETIKKLSPLPQIKSYPPMPEDSFTWLFMIPKKQHEIKTLAPHLFDLYEKNHMKRVLDVGGGLGLLSQTLNNYYHLPVTSVDKDPKLQETGRARHEKNARHPHNKVMFKNLLVDEQGEFSNLIDEDTLTVGLHTCGKLAVDFLRISSEKKARALVNFGCCYHKLEEVGAQNISNFSQKDSPPLWMNRFALTLSSRAHRKMDEKDYDLKLKVKRYRYAIHILLYDHFGIKTPVTLGNSSPKLYDETFSVYAQEQLKRLNLSYSKTKEELDQFFEDPELQLLIQRMLAAGLIRNAFGRLLELYLILDRAIYLEERGHEVEVCEFFDEEISPRNIGISAFLGPTSRPNGPLSF